MNRNAEIDSDQLAGTRLPRAKFGDGTEGENHGHVGSSDVKRRVTARG
jgi:hypothetical protein